MVVWITYMYKSEFRQLPECLVARAAGLRPSLRVIWRSWVGAASCVARGGRSARTSARRRHTWKVWHPCACGNGVSARQTVRTAIRTPATGKCTASHLHILQGYLAAFNHQNVHSLSISHNNVTECWMTWVLFFRFI